MTAKLVIRPFVYSPRRFDRLITWLEEYGEEVDPRGQKTIEVTNAHLVIRDPRDRLIYDPARQMNVAFALAEFAQVMHGGDSSEFIEHFAGKMKDFRAYGAPSQIGGAYGPRLAKHIPIIIEKLVDDPFTRQAVISIYDRGDLQAKPHLVPCTLSLQFLLRNGLLDLIVTMRSNDAWWGTTYDVFLFTMIQEWVAMRLKVKLGEFYLNDGSLHFYYERDSDARGRLWSRNPNIQMLPLDESVDPDTLYDAMVSARDLESRKFWKQLKDYEATAFYNLAIPARYWAARKAGDVIEMKTCFDNIRDRALREMLKLWPPK